MSEPDFLKLWAAYTAIGQKDARNKQYATEIAPFLVEVADELSQQFASQKLYPHISNFRTHILFRLGPHKKTTHRASVAVSFNDDCVEYGLDLTHALGDAYYLRDLFREKTDEIAQQILKLKEYWLWMPNAGITEVTDIDEFDLTEMKKLLLKYDPKAMRECYFMIKREYKGETMSKEEMVKVFVEERKRFGWLLDGIVSGM